MVITKSQYGRLSLVVDNPATVLDIISNENWSVVDDDKYELTVLNGTGRLGKSLKQALADIVWNCEYGGYNYLSIAYIDGQMTYNTEPGTKYYEYGLVGGT